MSEQHGVSPSLASIATTPPTHGTPSTTSTTVPSDGQPQAPLPPVRAESLPAPGSSNPARPSSTPSTKVHIPKLSAATTELLARVTGRLKGEPQQQQQRNDITPAGWTPSSLPQSLNSANTMKASSTIIELPTAPFVYSQHMTAAASSQNPASKPQQNHSSATSQSPSLVNIAPKPSDRLFTGMPTPIQSQLPPSTSAAQTAKTLSPASMPKRVQGATASPRQRKAGTNGGRRRKRRRGNDSDSDIIRAGDSSSDESDVAPRATQTKSGRQVNRPSLYVPPAPSPTIAKETNTLDASDSVHVERVGTQKRKRAVRRSKDANISCILCQRGHSPPSNTIVFCDKCNRAWHQLCHDPPIASEVVAVKEKEWLCRVCTPTPISIAQPTVVRSNPRLGVSSLTFDRPIFPPTEIPNLEVGAEGFSTEERRGFLSCLSHSALVELLIRISDSNPTVPMFPQNLKSLHSSKFSFQPKIPTPSPNPEAGSTLAVEVSESLGAIKTPDVLPTPSSDHRKQHDDSDSSEYEVEDHRLYPRAGNGFSLPTDADDLDIMREDADCRTFSYTLHRPAHLHAQDNQPLPTLGYTPFSV
ncbi:hypothetical protein BDV59DRAFT_170942 [Aspergillus ambiguus]|uniref:uncharacterized protein n=1 Tax=Aspergillus ambiguus TaxID=176160 RepID=UPI003CCDFCDE